MGAKYYNSGVDSTLLAPVTAATTARTSSTLDTQGADYATIRVVLGAEANTNSTNVGIIIAESDLTVVSNFVTWDATYNRTVDNTAGVVATSHIDLRGRKRYMHVTVTPDTTTNGAVIGAVTATLFKEVKTGTTSDYGEDVVIA